MRRKGRAVNTLKVLTPPAYGVRINITKVAKLNPAFNPVHEARIDSKPAVQGGLSTADRVMTVSPGYAWEIQTPEGGWGMEDMLRSRAYALNGVLNGIDEVEWNPSTDKHITKQYSSSNFSKGKAANKAALQKELGLPVRPEVSLLGICIGLAFASGIWLVDKHSLAQSCAPRPMIRVSLTT